MAIITSYSTVCLRVCSGWQQSKHQCSALLALCEGFHKWMVWFVYPYSLGSYSLELGSHMTSPVPLKQPWRIWVNLACIETITKHDKIQTIYMHTSCEILYTQNRQIWWHHDMETLSTLLAICVGNPPFTEMWPWALISAGDQVLIGCGLKETAYCLSPWPVTIELPCGGLVTCTQSETLRRYLLTEEIKGRRMLTIPHDFTLVGSTVPLHLSCFYRNN